MLRSLYFPSHIGIEKMQIDKVLPHKAPFLFVDNISENEYMKYAKGTKKVYKEEFWAEGHFPGNPIFPGVLLLETMAQIGGFIFADENGDMASSQFAYLTKVDQFRIKHKVVPGDTIEVQAKLIECFYKYYKIGAKAYVDKRLVADAEITYTFLEKL